MNLMPKTVLPTSPSPLWMKTDTMVKMHGHFSPQFWPQSLMWSEIAVLKSCGLVALLLCSRFHQEKRKNSTLVPFHSIQRPRTLPLTTWYNLLLKTSANFC